MTDSQWDTDRPFVFDHLTLEQEAAIAAREAEQNSHTRPAPPDPAARRVAEGHKERRPEMTERMTPERLKEIRHYVDGGMVGYPEFVGELLRELDAVTRERDEARGMLRTATVRLGILRDRMEGCEESHPDTHRVSLLEVPAWIEEQQEVIDT